jgi:uncharacterized protein
LGDRPRKGEDDGVILLVAPNEKKVRIETGYGAEGFLPDILAGRIIRNDILPRFREGDMGAADRGGRRRDPPADEPFSRRGAGECRRRRSKAESARDRAPTCSRWSSGEWSSVRVLAMARRAGGHRYRYSGKGRRRGRGFDTGDAAIILWGLSALGGRGGGWGGGGGFGGWGGGGGGFGGFSRRRRRLRRRRSIGFMVMQEISGRPRQGQRGDRRSGIDDRRRDRRGRNSA